MTAFVGDLLPHQAGGLEWLLAHPKALLADDVGLGKTITTCAVLGALADAGDIATGDPRRRALIVAPASLLTQWEGELARFLPGMSVTVSDHKRTPTEARRGMRQAARRPDIELVSYEGLVTALGGYEAKRFPVMVLDETGEIRGGGRQHAAVCSITGQASRVLGLTASPLETHLDETHRMLRACQVPGLPTSRAWSDRYVTYEERTFRTPWGVQRKLVPVGINAANLAELRSFLGSVMLRRTAGEVGLRLPEVQELTHYVPLTPAQREEYDRAASTLTGLDRHSALDRACNLAEGASAKAQRALDLISDDARKTVVYAYNLEHLDAMEGLLSAAGIPSVRLDGMTDERARQEALRAFQEDGRVRVLVGSPVLERGFNLQHSNRMISLGVEYNPARNVQRVGRVRRIGSPHDVVRHDIIVTDTEHERRRLSTAFRRSGDFEAVFGTGAEVTV